jgi:hypothetical protein
LDSLVVSSLTLFAGRLPILPFIFVSGKVERNPKRIRESVFKPDSEKSGSFEELNHQNLHSSDESVN